MQDKSADDASDKVHLWNYRLIYLSGVTSEIARRMSAPDLVLPFLYLALGAPPWLAALLLPCVTISTLIGELVFSSVLKSPEKAQNASVLTDFLAALAVAVLALSVTQIDVHLAAVLFVVVAVLLGICQGISKIGKGHIIGIAVARERRTRMTFFQSAFAGIVTILILIGTSILLEELDPLDRHFHVLWFGILATVLTALCYFGVRLTGGQKEIGSGPTRPFVHELKIGMKKGRELPWFRKFLYARLSFVSVELAMPFYTIHAVSEHVTNSRSLIGFIVSASLGRFFGSIVWLPLALRDVRWPMILGCLVAGFAAAFALFLELIGAIHHVWAFATAIFLLSFGASGVRDGRKVYFTNTVDPENRPPLQALSDVSVGLLGFVFAAILGYVAHLHDTRLPLLFLVSLNVLAAVAAMTLPLSPTGSPTGGIGKPSQHRA